MDVVNLNLERFEGVEGGIHIIEANPKTTH
jgi:hypothetical protein